MPFETLLKIEKWKLKTLSHGKTLFPLLFRKIIHHKSYLISLSFFSFLFRKIINHKSYLIPLFFFSLFLIPSPAEAATLQKPANNLGLVGYWPMNEGTSTVAADVSGGGNTGTMYPGIAGDNTATSTMWVNAKQGRGINFDGTDDLVQLPRDVLGTGDITISAWIKADSFGAGNFGRIIDNGKTRLLVDSASGNKFIFTSDAATNAVGTSNSVRLGEWQFITVTRTSAGVANIYINGVLNGTADQTSGTPAATAGTTYIGNNGNPGSRSFDGILDEIRVYSRILSAAEVATLYNAKAGTRKVLTERGLIGYWSFNDATSTKAGDSSGLGNHGTLTNMATSTSGGWTTGARGGALRFDGTDDYVRVPTAGLSSEEGTVLAWAYPEETGTNDYVFQGNGTLSDRLYLQWSNGNLNVYRSNPAVGFTIKSNAALNTWHHVALTWKNGSMSGYYNGRLAGTDTYTEVGGAWPTSDIGQQGGADRQFKGKIDEVKVYNRELTADEIWAEYNQKFSKMNASRNNFLTDGLVGNWSFNGADVDWSTGTAYDRSGQANNGRLIGMSTTTSVTYGKVGQALNFDGSNDYVQVPHNTSLNPGSGSFSAMAWIYLDNVTGTRAILQKGTSITCVTGTPAWILYTSNNQMAIVVTDGTDCTSSAVSSTTLSVATWHHIGFTWDGTYARYFVDGNFVYQTGNGSVDDVSNSDDLFIGQTGASIRFHKGNIDEARVYNRTLTDAEVKQLYLLGK